MTDDEIDRLQVGDVIKSPSGAFRVVRLVDRPTERRIFVGLTIRKCSWTRRCYTLLCRYDLRAYTKLPFRVKLDSELDSMVLRELDSSTAPLIDCCDIKGVA